MSRSPRGFAISCDNCRTWMRVSAPKDLERWAAGAGWMLNTRIGGPTARPLDLCPTCVQVHAPAGKEQEK